MWGEEDDAATVAQGEPFEEEMWNDGRAGQVRARFVLNNPGMLALPLASPHVSCRVQHIYQ